MRFLDSTGLRLVLELDAAAREASQELTIIRGSAVVQRIFEVTQVSERLQFVDRVDRGVAAAAGRYRGRERQRSGRPMTRRIEAGPVLVGLGALVCWSACSSTGTSPNVTAWEAFEVLDLLMAALSLAAIVAVVGTVRPSAAVIERHQLPLIVVALAVIVASQILDPPPGVAGDPIIGAWLALGAVLVMCVGAVLSLGRVSFALTVEGRDTRRHVSAVDPRSDPTTTEGPAVRP